MSHTCFSNYPDFTLFQGDCMELIGQLPDNSINAIFADPPYFLSNGGISVQSGKQVCVDKGDWDKGGTPEHIYQFNRQWLSLCRNKLKDNGTIWISGTHHNIFVVHAAAAKAKEGKNDTPDGLLADPVIDIGKLAQIIASDDSLHSRVTYSFSSAIILAMRRA